MPNGNETNLCDCRFLSDEHFDPLYATFIEAFSDYVFPFALTETQFRNHINLNAVDLCRTAGYFDSDKLVGFSLNGFGDWNGRPTVYDAGTGVIPSMRRRGISEAMFDMMLPVFKERSISQSLLEVVTKNGGAIRLYEKLGFSVTRELALFQCDGKVKPAVSAPQVEIRDMPEPDWKLLTSFWDGRPSWQNSVEAVQRSLPLKRILGAFHDDACVGYVVFSSKFGRVAQMAVDKAHRTRGIGTALLNTMQAETTSGYSLQIINIDRSLTDAITFLRNRGFYERLTQLEMLKLL
ncbi:MAG: GNAT family N-acetyltransferase [Pyrinomonadaceae bacterium]|nr:GNAT family N-acetyltransferase [Pyrinomonadaceae bacterium]